MWSSTPQAPEFMEEILQYMRHMEIGVLNYPEDLRPLYAISGPMRSRFPIKFSKDERVIHDGTTEELKLSIEQFAESCKRSTSEIEFSLGDIITDFTYQDPRKFVLGEGCCLIWRETNVRERGSDQRLESYDETLIQRICHSLQKIKNAPLTLIASYLKIKESVDNFEQRLTKVIINDRRRRLEVYHENSSHSSATLGAIAWVRLKDQGFTNLDPDFRYSICLHELKRRRDDIVCTMFTPPVGRDNYDEVRRRNPMLLVRPTVCLVLVLSLSKTSSRRLIEDFVDMLQLTVFNIMHDADRISVIVVSDVNNFKVKSFGKIVSCRDELARQIITYVQYTLDNSLVVDENLGAAFEAGMHECLNVSSQMQTPNMPIRLLIFTADDMSKISVRKDYDAFCCSVKDVAGIPDLHTTLFSFHQTPLHFAETFPGVESSQNVNFFNVELCPSEAGLDTNAITRDAIRTSLNTFVTILSDVCFSPEGTILLASNYRFIALDQKGTLI